MIAGVLAVMYGFELVSVPLVKEHHELLWVGGGAILICGCAAGLLVNARKVTAKPGSTQS